MSRESLKLMQKRSWCKGCGICVDFCPVKILFIDKDQKVTISEIEKCIKCKQCELRCPDFAIFLEGETNE